MSANKSDSTSKQPISDIDRLVHEPARYLIMAYLYVVESADALFLQKETELTWGNLSSHLSKLEEAGYVEIKKSIVNKKTHTVAKLTGEGRKAFEEYKEKMKEVLK